MTAPARSARVRLPGLIVRPDYGEPVVRHPQCTHTGDVIMDHVLPGDAQGRQDCEYCGEPIEPAEVHP